MNPEKDATGEGCNHDGNGNECTNIIKLVQKIQPKVSPMASQLSSSPIPKIAFLSKKGGGVYSMLWVCLGLL